MSERVSYNKFQQIITTVFYLALVATCLITIGGLVYTIADLIMQEAPDYEFRTTVVKDQLTYEDIMLIGNGCRCFRGLLPLKICFLKKM